ncbi:MAG: type II secretion system protein [Lentisphaeraceae bacterium]|nr:type II secretion system protein [Lentisphaeraceae bacterium]
MKNMSSKNSSSFTLIELLVVVAIIGILMSMLLPSIMKAKKASQTAVCINNQSQMYRAGLSYTNNNKGRIVPAAIGPYAKRYSISFDDLIAEYMGRNLSQAEIDLPYNHKDVDALKCPSSIIEPDKEWKTQKPRSVCSYAMNTGWRWRSVTFAGITSMGIEKDGVVTSSFISTLTDSGNLLYSGETHMTGGGVGYGSFAGLMGMDENHVGKPVHSGLRSVYVLVDGHSEVLLPSFAKTKMDR